MNGRMMFRSRDSRLMFKLISLGCFAAALFYLSLHPGAPTTNSCVVPEHNQPPQQHPECFLQRYCMKYELQPVGICDGRRVMLFIFIYSIPGNYQRRQMIRQTWLDRSVLGDAVQHVFLLGHASDEDMVQQEARTYNDIVVMDMRESFCSLTLKGIAGLHFASSFCPGARFVMKTDDDMFVNMFLLQSTLRTMLTKRQTEGVMMGFVWYGGVVYRSGQYAVSALQYAGSRYPPFCSGSGYIMSMDVTRTLYKLAMEDQSKALLHLDDPYITGVLADRAKLTHIQLDIFYIVSKSGYTYFSDKSASLPDEVLNDYLFLHIHDEDTVDMSPQQHADIWHRLVQLQVKTPARPILAAPQGPDWLLPEWVPWGQQMMWMIGDCGRTWRAYRKHSMYEV